MISFIFNLIFIAVLFFFPIDTSSNPSKFDGNWEAYYFEFGGKDAKGTLISSSIFKMSHQTETCGDFEWNLVYFCGTKDTIVGLYRLNEEDNQIVLFNKNENVIEFEITLSNDQLSLSGEIEYEYGLIKARRMKN